MILPPYEDPAAIAARFVNIARTHGYTIRYRRPGSWLPGRSWCDPITRMRLVYSPPCADMRLRFIIEPGRSLLVYAGDEFELPEGEPVPPHCSPVSPVAHPLAPSEPASAPAPTRASAQPSRKPAAKKPARKKPASKLKG